MYASRHGAATSDGAWSASRSAASRNSTFLDCHFSPSIGTPLLERGQIDEVDLHVLPRLLGDGTHLYGVAGGSMRKLQNLVGDDPNARDQPPFRTTYEN